MVYVVFTGVEDTAVYYLIVCLVPIWWTPYPYFDFLLFF